MEIAHISVNPIGNQDQGIHIHNVLGVMTRMRMIMKKLSRCGNEASAAGARMLKGEKLLKEAKEMTGARKRHHPHHARKKRRDLRIRTLKIGPRTNTTTSTMIRLKTMTRRCG